MIFRMQTAASDHERNSAFAWAKNPSRWLVPVTLTLIAAHAAYFKRGIDFDVFYQAGRRLMAGESLYQLSESSPFKYLPVVAQWFAPLTFLSERSAHTLWMFISAAGLFRFFRWCSQRAQVKDRWPIHMMALALATPFILQQLALGQSDGLLVGLMAESESQKNKRPWLSGLLWAAVCLVKPPFLLFLWPTIALRQWRRVPWLIGGLATGMLAGMAPFGSSYLQQLRSWQALMQQTTPAMLDNVDNQSLFAMFHTFAGAWAGSAALSIGIVATAAIFFGAATCAVRVLHKWDAPRADFLAAALAFYLTAFLSPLGWQSNLVVLIALLYYLLSDWLRADSRSATRPLIGVALGAAAGAAILNHDVIGYERFQKLLGLRYFGWAGALVALVAIATVFIQVSERRAVRTRATARTG